MKKTILLMLMAFALASCAAVTTPLQTTPTIQKQDGGPDRCGTC